METLPQAFAPWHDFYALLGGASATMVGLLFVAVSVASGAFSRDRRGAVRMFLSASVVQFASVLAICLLVLAPFAQWEMLGGALAACGLFGMGYFALAWCDAVRDGIAPRIDLEDRIWYAVLPVLGYALETGAGVAVTQRAGWGCAALAGAVGVLLAAAVHNAWDITVWSVTQRHD